MQTTILNTQKEIEHDKHNQHHWMGKPRWRKLLHINNWILKMQQLKSNRLVTSFTNKSALPGVSSLHYSSTTTTVLSQALLPYWEKRSLDSVNKHAQNVIQWDWIWNVRLNSHICETLSNILIFLIQKLQTKHLLQLNLF